MRHTYIVTYDISDPKRLRQVYKTMLGWGDHIQLSVFQCELNPRELIELRVELGRVIRHTEDQVLFADLGTTEGDGRTAISSIGRAYVDAERVAVVI